jgi:hypothetical protein
VQPIGYVKLIDTPFGKKLKPVLTVAVPVGAKLYTTPPAQPAPVQEPDHSDELTIAYLSGVHRGKELAVAQAVPDAIIEAGESPEFRDGWNECRETMLQMLKARNT